MSTTSQPSSAPTTSRERQPKVNFFIVGAPKCGTTAWFEYLRSHPDIFIPEMKEPCFFARDFPTFSRVGSETEYSELFIEGDSAKVLGDASADYLFSEDAAKAIHEYNSKAKILILLRDQWEQLPSLHNHQLWLFWEEIEDFERAWRLSGRRGPGEVPPQCPDPRMVDYAAMGRFREQVQRYLDSFPREQILVIRFRDWVSDPRAAYLQILAFLGLEDDGRTDFPRVNEGVSYRSRRLARFLAFPPLPARKLGRAVKWLTGVKGSTLYGGAQRMVRLLTAPAYRKEISAGLRDEIRRYYAEDNRQLAAKLERPHTPAQDRRDAGAGSSRSSRRVTR